MIIPVMMESLKSRFAAAASVVFFLPSPLPAGEAPVHDIVVYGDSSGAVVAAIDAKRRGLSVILVNPTAFPGGMSASGLGATDFLGRRNTFGGIASEFYDGVAAAYGQDFVRSFEPHVGLNVFKKLIADAGLEVVYNEPLDREMGVKMAGKRIDSITALSGKTYRGKMFIDATYVGDLMAAAGVSYTVGREAESQYGEDLAGVRRGDTNPRVHYTQRDKDHFIKGVVTLERPITLVEAIANAGGIETGLFERNTIELADLDRSFVSRKGQQLPVDFRRLLNEGDMKQNIEIEPNDFIFIASTITNDYYVLGAVVNPGVQGLTPDATVVSAISRRGGLTDRAWSDRVLVIRGSLTKPETFVIGLKDILAAKGNDFKLQPKDIVYISERPWVVAEDILKLALSAFATSAASTWVNLNVDPILTSP